MKSILLKRVPKSVTDKAKAQQYSKWGSDTFINKAPQKGIGIMQSKKMA